MSSLLEGGQIVLIGEEVPQLMISITQKFSGDEEVLEATTSVLSLLSLKGECLEPFKLNHQSCQVYGEFQCFQINVKNTGSI